MNKSTAQAGKIQLLLIAPAMLAIGLLMGQGLRSDKSAQSRPAACQAIDNEEESHEGHDHGQAAHADEGVITLADSAIQQFGIQTAHAGGGKIGAHTVLPAAIALNEDKKAHVTPRIPGVAVSVRKTLGAKVTAGEVLAVIHSRELADFKAGYLAAKETVLLAETVFEREKSLWEKKISAEQDYLEARRSVAEARIALRLAEQKLYALGFSEAYLEGLAGQPEGSYIVYEVTAPIEGTIIEKHLTTGEVLKDDSEIFVIADLTEVWVNINVGQKDLPRVKQGQKAVVKTDHSRAEGVVSYLGGVVDENTRTALARIVLPNEAGQWRPGTFATADLYVEQFDGDVVVPRDAVVMMENKSFVFLAADEGFVPQEVQLGRANDEWTEVISGLEAGRQYVSRGAYTLKSELMKSNEDPCGGH
ncbi:MAG: efflux RND transporter periplasmic adaptor subunit [Planctomycetaceae bacterium]|nr:efflux RND transporter periplasmic adaptor subunit [Planctomycetaceae bacterium]